MGAASADRAGWGASPRATKREVEGGGWVAKSRRAAGKGRTRHCSSAYGLEADRADRWRRLLAGRG